MPGADGGQCVLGWRRSRNEPHISKGACLRDLHALGAPYGTIGRPPTNGLPAPVVSLYRKFCLGRSSKDGWHSRDLAATGLYKLGVSKFLTLAQETRLEVVQLQLMPAAAVDSVPHAARTEQRPNGAVLKRA